MGDTERLLCPGAPQGPAWFQAQPCQGGGGSCHSGCQPVLPRSDLCLDPALSRSTLSLGGRRSPERGGQCRCGQHRQIGVYAPSLLLSQEVLPPQPYQPIFIKTARGPQVTKRPIRILPSHHHPPPNTLRRRQPDPRPAVMVFPASARPWKIHSGEREGGRERRARKQV